MVLHIHVTNFFFKNHEHKNSYLHEFFADYTNDPIVPLFTYLHIYETDETVCHLHFFHKQLWYSFHTYYKLLKALTGEYTTEISHAICRASSSYFSWNTFNARSSSSFMSVLSSGHRSNFISVSRSDVTNSLRLSLSEHICKIKHYPQYIVNIHLCISSFFQNWTIKWISLQDSVCVIFQLC